MQLTPIGVIHSPYKEKEDAPKQGRWRQDAFRLEIFEEFTPGLKDVETATHLFVLYWADKVDRSKLLAVTPYEEEPHGVFATRSPGRPNPVNLSVVDLVERKGNTLYVKGLDALDQSAIIDIKPYNAEVDSIPEAKLGWFEKLNKKFGRE